MNVLEAVADEVFLPIKSAPRDRFVIVAMIYDDELTRVALARHNGVGWYDWGRGDSCHWATHWLRFPAITNSEIARGIAAVLHSHGHCDICGMAEDDDRHLSEPHMYVEPNLVEVFKGAAREDQEKEGSEEGSEAGG